MFKTFILGLLVGVFGSVALLYFAPVVDLERERSIIAVQPNGGINEAFHVKLPADRIMAGVAGGRQAFPAGVTWPAFMHESGSQAEVFKVRNDEDRVVGVASRVAGPASSPYVEWALHLPARGTMYILLDARSGEGAGRSGDLRAGTREFSDRSGRVVERFVEASEDPNGGEGRLELLASLVGSDTGEPGAPEVQP